VRDDFAAQASSWADERARLESEGAAALDELRAQLAAAGAAAMDEQRNDFEERLAEGRRESEQRLRMLEEEAGRERADLQKQLAAKGEEMEREVQRWMQRQEQAVSHTREEGNSQQRRLAAAFKAAREITAAKEDELRRTHDDLARRFASRESREDDLIELERQRRQLDKHQRLLRHRDSDLKALSMELHNRDETDRIFSEPEMRRTIKRATPGFVPAMPGKKVGDRRGFLQRDEYRRTRSLPRPSSAGTPPARPVLLGHVVSVR